MENLSKIMDRLIYLVYPVASSTKLPTIKHELKHANGKFICNLILNTITETSPYKSYPRFAPNIVNMGETGVGIENEKYSLYLNFIDKTCKIYLFIFV